MDDSELKLEVALEPARPMYMLPKDPVASEVLIPALRNANKLDVMMGYFSSSSFAEIAPGLATFLSATDAPIRLIVSPYLTDADFRTLLSSKDKQSELARSLFIEDVPSEDKLARHTLKCLAWLIHEQRLEIRIAVMREALFHPKVWLFDDHSHQVALHGSTNFTQSGLTRNREQLTLSRSWKGEEPQFHIARLNEEFELLYAGGDEDCCVLSLEKAIQKDILTSYKQGKKPSESDYRKQWQKAIGIDVDEEDGINQLTIPEYLEYEHGEYAHQGEAVKKWFDNECRGILEMATGSGKTITSMICSTKLQDREGSLFVVISAPYKPLIEQWCGEVAEFGILPINLTTVSGAAGREREIRGASRRLRMGVSKTEVVLVSNNTLCTPEFVNALELVDTPKLHVADECHNLGAEGFTSNPPEVFDYRLGLSATPVRQYDPEGSSNLTNYFGDICFSFDLEDAIGKCLTEYDYHVHFVELTDDEMEEWNVLTSKISSYSWMFNSNEKSSHLDMLLRERRLLIETAFNKISILDRLLKDIGPRSIRYGLVYTTDKKPEQLDQVNRLLNSKGIMFRQLTHEETKDRKKTNQILQSFQGGTYQILTAKRVLDEGVNIPQINIAFILASTTLERQWVQRRGRLLRTCKAIGKTHAVIHDFVALPPNTSDNSDVELDEDARKLVRSELKRVWEFARLCRNATDEGGPYDAVTHLQNLANQYD